MMSKNTQMSNNNKLWSLLINNNIIIVKLC